MNNLKILISFFSLKYMYQEKYYKIKKEYLKIRIQFKKSQPIRSLATIHEELQSKVNNEEIRNLILLLLEQCSKEILMKENEKNLIINELYKRYQQDMMEKDRIINSLKNIDIDIQVDL